MNRAKQIRLDRGFGVVDAAEGAGISTKTLKKVEAGDDVLAASLTRLARFYEVSPSSLLTPAIHPDQPEEAAA